MTLFRPSECGLRVYLRHIGEPEADPSPFELVLRRLGVRHEQQHLATLPKVVDLSSCSEEERLSETIKGIEQRAPAIYQSAFKASTTLGKTQVTVIGRPDFLLFNGTDYVVRDSKLSLRIDEKNHPEIIQQLQLYGWLFEQSLGRRPALLEVYNGRKELVPLPFDGGASALSMLERIVALRQLQIEPYEPVGISKCDGCAFEKRCWTRAEEHRDISLVMEVDQSLARVLVSSGITTPAELLAKFDISTLGELARPWGAKMQKVGARAAKILVSAEVLETGAEKVIASPPIPNSANYVMFDLEGMPPYLDELDKIYLWGLQVFGAATSEYIPSSADFGDEGDRKAWEGFLHNAQTVLNLYGDIPFVHWSPYEKTYLNRYIARYGDPDRVAARVLRNLLDIYPITKTSIVLPLPSYSLKVIERYAGFQRRNPEQDGAWSMATFIEATETENQQQRAEVMQQILKYNQEDLEATWVVLQWLRGKAPGSRAAHP